MRGEWVVPGDELREEEQRAKKEEGETRADKKVEHRPAVLFVTHKHTPTTLVRLVRRQWYILRPSSFPVQTGASSDLPLLRKDQCLCKWNGASVTCMTFN